MHERTRTVEVVVPVPPDVAEEDIQRGVAARAEDMLQAMLQRAHLRELSKTGWACRQITADEAAERAAGIDRKCLGNLWLASAVIAVTEDL